MTKPTEPPPPLPPSKQLSRGWTDAMDGQSIARRLAVVDELYAAWLVLKQARRIEDHERESLDGTIRQQIK